MKSIAIAIAAAGLFTSCATVFEPDRSARAPRLDGFGSASLAATTANADAARLFAQGMEQAYAFNNAEAVRAFKAALAADPACALCAWGVAWQLGPNINAVERGDLGDARRHVALSLRLAAGATPFERALIDAMAVRYVGTRDVLTDGPPDAAVCGRPGSGRAHPLDIAYADRMRGLADRLADNADVVSLYAEAELVATRDDWWDTKTGRPAGRIADLAERIERALPASPDHTGLNHYLIHTLDASPEVARAVAAADKLGALAPGSPHLLHMPAHIYIRVGRYGDAVRVNEAALAAEVASTATIEAQGQKPVWNWDNHNLHFLWYAALIEGRGDLALATARRSAERAADGRSVFAEYRRALPVLTLARLERWDAVLAEPLPAGSHGAGAAIGQAMQGLALLRTGKADAANERLAAVQAQLGRMAADDKPLLATVAAWLTAEVALADGRGAAARDAYAKAAASEDEAGGEPPLFASGSRLALGGALLRSRDWPGAEAAYRDELKHNPGNGWALRGLVSALDGQSRPADAANARRELAAAWKAADAALLR